MNIIILGAGTFGTAIGNELSVNKNNNVTLFSRNVEKVNEINKFNTNKDVFPKVSLSKNLFASYNKEDLLNADVIFIALPSSNILEVIKNLKSFFKNDVLIVNLSKGIFEDGVTIVRSIKKLLDSQNVITLKGPSFAVEIIEHAETLLTLGYTTKFQYEIISKIINKTSLHIDSTLDVKGVELLSVLKNIYALIQGIVDAKYNSANTRFLILTIAFSEIRIILKHLGGSEDTLFLACGFGDLCLTSLNDLSRNRTLGLVIGKDSFTSEYKTNSVILEGLNAINIIYKLVDDKLLTELQLLKKIHNFFLNKKTEFTFNFNELIDIKTID